MKLSTLSYLYELVIKDGAGTVTEEHKARLKEVGLELSRLEKIHQQSVGGDYLTVGEAKPIKLGYDPGSKVHCIKWLRDLVPALSLKQAKDLVEMDLPLHTFTAVQLATAKETIPVPKVWFADTTVTMPVVDIVERSCYLMIHNQSKMVAVFAKPPEFNPTEQLVIQVAIRVPASAFKQNIIRMNVDLPTNEVMSHAMTADLKEAVESAYGAKVQVIIQGTGEVHEIHGTGPADFGDDSTPA
jgi:hypothetical protein